MSILVDQKTKLVVQGLTGREGAFHSRQMREYGTVVVAGVTPGQGNQLFLGIPVFDTVEEAVVRTGCDASVIFVPPAFAADAAMEAADAGIQTVVCLTEGVPILDMVSVRQFLQGKEVKLIGPNSPGIISPGKCKIGVMAGYIHQEGTVGVVSRSGTLMYEVVDQLTKLGIGQSTYIRIGGDPIIGLNFVDILAMFEEDQGTEAVVIIGEIGGRAEEEAAEFFRSHMRKPVVAFIAGLTAPPGRRMGHAGAIISGGIGSAQDKIRALETAGITVVKSPGEVGLTVTQVMGRS